MSRDNLGDILLRKKLIDRYQLQSALAHQKAWGRPLGATLVELGFCRWDVVMSALSEQAGLPIVDWSSQKISKELAALLPRRIAERCRAVPLGLEGSRREVLVVAVAAPALLTTLDELRLAAGKHGLKAMLAADADVARAFGIIYGLKAKDAVPSAVASSQTKAESGTDAAAPKLPSNPVPAPASPLRRNSVLLLGWHPEVVGKLKAILGPAGFSTRASTAEEILMADPNDLVISPLQAAEALVVAGMKFPARLLLIGRNPQAEESRAKTLGAVAFLTTPLDPGDLLRAVQAAATPTSSNRNILKN